MYLHLSFRVCVSHPVSNSVHGTVVLQQPVVISPVWGAKNIQIQINPILTKAALHALQWAQ